MTRSMKVILIISNDSWQGDKSDRALQAEEDVVLTLCWFGNRLVNTASLSKY
jgi:hypothetical protein